MLETRTTAVGMALILIAACAAPGRSAFPGRDYAMPRPAADLAVIVDCGTAMVVGLQWHLANVPSAAPIRYRVLRNGTNVADTAAPWFDDTSVAGDNRYQYVVVAVTGRRQIATSSPVTVDTPPASGKGQSPYCPSAQVRGMVWRWQNALSLAHGSDLWPTTWGADGNTYALFGDGGGFEGDDVRGRSSFGVAQIAGGPPFEAPTMYRNLYGGVHSPHPSVLRGKASTLIALGSDFYALAGIYRPSDTRTDYPDQPWTAPNHIEIAASTGNAWSWRDGTWTFCSADASGNRHLRGAICPRGFVQYGPGDAEAPDRYVYLYATDPATHWRTGVKRVPINSYLLRVPANRILNRAAYRYFAGIDGRGRPSWSADSRRKVPVFSDGNRPRPGCAGLCNMSSVLQEALYDAPLRLYIAIAQGDYVAQTSFYEAPTPWGPWHAISYNNIDPQTGTGGWADLGTAGGASLGVHAVAAWTSRSGRTLWMTYSGGGRAPPGSLFPPPGTAMDSLSLVSVQLTPAATR